jgi:hypothetical protein
VVSPSSRPFRRSIGTELAGDEAVGLGILRRALEAPIRQNVGAHGEVVVDKVKGL